MITIYKDIPDFEGLYKANMVGNILSVERKVGCTYNSKRLVRGRILKPKISNKGYYVVVLSNKQIKKQFLVHRLVALTFIPNPDNKPCVNHKDGDTKNNLVSNLEWVTYKENTVHLHKYLNPNTPIGARLPQTKLNELQVRVIRRMNGDMTHKEIGKYFNISASSISYIISRKNWKHIK